MKKAISDPYQINRQHSKQQIHLHDEERSSDKAKPLNEGNRQSVSPQHADYEA